jgi:hypothetical protein
VCESTFPAPLDAGGGASAANPTVDSEETCKRGSVDNRKICSVLDVVSEVVHIDCSRIQGMAEARRPLIDDSAPPLNISAWPPYPYGQVEPATTLSSLPIASRRMQSSSKLANPRRLFELRSLALSLLFSLDTNLWVPTNHRNPHIVDYLLVVLPSWALPSTYGSEAWTVPNWLNRKAATYARPHPKPESTPVCDDIGIIKGFDEDATHDRPRLKCFL